MVAAKDRGKIMNYFDVEVTDTFGGEANYCWVRRYIIEMPDWVERADRYSDREIVRKAKAAYGWTGLRCDTDGSGDMLTVRPRGLLQVMFITYRDLGIHPLPESESVETGAEVSP